jgi:hypothetical protein
LDKTLSTALSALHQATLKPLGFHKNAATFSRAHADYTELFTVQASQRNGPWGRSFYVNCGLAFRDLPTEVPWGRLPNTHWAAPIDTVVSCAPRHWDYSQDDDLTELTERLAACIIEASEKLAVDPSRYRSEYLKRVAALEGQGQIPHRTPGH